VVHYDRPLVVLINEGTRSGKESLAYQFRQGDRATVVGTTTAGAFTAGRGLLTDPAQPYFLFLASAEPRLDGQVIEGVGVAPHVAVPYRVTADGDDPQLARALEIVEGLVRRRPEPFAGQPEPTMRLGSTIRSNSAPVR
jgi:carboxyl-terminal processing protease